MCLRRNRHESERFRTVWYLEILRHSMKMSNLCFHRGLWRNLQHMFNTETWAAFMHIIISLLHLIMWEGGGNGGWWRGQARPRSSWTIKLIQGTSTPCRCRIHCPALRATHWSYTMNSSRNRATWDYRWSWCWYRHKRLIPRPAFSGEWAAWG